MAKDKKEKGAGYKNPPKKTQWKKGQSGNPKGRPKKAKIKSDMEKDIWNIFAEEMNETILMTTPTGQQEISKKRALIKLLIEKSLKEKDFRSINKLFQIFEKIEVIEDIDDDGQSINITFATYPDDENSNRTAADYFRDKDLEQ